MSATKQYREWLPHQPFLFPPSPHDWLDEGDLAYFIVDVVTVLDLSPIEAAIHSKDTRGTRPYHPRMMTASLLYGYCVGVMSSRKIEKATYRDVRVPTTPEGKPKPEAQRNFTDPDSRIMMRDGTYLQGYNGQAAVDDEHQIIVRCAVTNQPPDQQHLPPLVEQIRENCGRYPDKPLADAGYWDEEHVEFCEQRGIDPYIATGRLKHGESSPPIRGRPPKDLDAKGRMYRKLRTKRGRKEYARRKVIPEPVFGQIRVGQGFQQFLLRGIDKVQAEWSRVCAGHNLLEIFRVVGSVPT